MSLSERVRPDCEAAPWVVKEIKKMEAEKEELRTKAKDLERRLHDQYIAWEVYDRRFVGKVEKELRAENAQLKEDVLAEHQAAVDMFGKYDECRDKLQQSEAACAQYREALETVAGSDKKPSLAKLTAKELREIAPEALAAAKEGTTK